MSIIIPQFQYPDWDRKYLENSISLAMLAKQGFVDKGVTNREIRNEGKIRLIRFGILLAAFLFSLSCFSSQGFAKGSQRHTSRSLSQVISLLDNDQRLCEADISNLMGSELRIARNAIYARRGKHIYKSSEMAVCLSHWKWPESAKPFSEMNLTPVDWSNIELIQKAERNPFQPDNRTIEGAMRLYLDALIRGDSNAFLKLCHPDHPYTFTAYEIATLRLMGKSVCLRKDLEADFTQKGIEWDDFFGDEGDAARYRWTVSDTPFDAWKRQDTTYRLPNSQFIAFVKWQKIDGRWYIAEIAATFC